MPAALGLSFIFVGLVLVPLIPALVDGALVSTRALRLGLGLGRGSRGRGPLVAEREIVIGAGCVTSTEGILTSLTAPRIVIHAGAVVFWTVWAREGGESVA